ncbi:MAG: solute:sodium symporter family transporter [Planctomycetota bacterium]|jgi:SSS family solute:Na+ symporter
MELSWIDATVFLGFMATVVAVSLYAGRKERSSEDYFLAGRKLVWPLIGFSLIASNISTEHFVGMAGSAFGRVGLAIASYEWMAAVTLVIVAWWLLPKFLKAGIYTMPEFLEYRYSPGTRAIMAAYLMAAYIVVLLAVVLYSGAVAVITVFDIPSIFVNRWGMEPQAAEFWAVVASIWVIGIIAATYTIYGGLKSVVWSDLLQGSGLMLGGAIVTVLALKLLGGEVNTDGQRISGSIIEGWRRFTEANAGKLHTVLPWNDPDVPWVAVFIGGLWIPNLFYWGMNQFITQRTLGAKSLAEGQKGIMLAACLKLIIPFIIVMPGIMAFQLFGDEIVEQTRKAYVEQAAVSQVDQTMEATILEKAGEKAYPYMMSKILPPWLRGIMFAALCGAVMSTFNSGLNSASTIFTIDFYRKYIQPDASPAKLVAIGRIATAVVVVVACLWSPVILSYGSGVFKYIQEIWGFITPGIVAVFLVGLLVKQAPALAAQGALLLSVPLYGFCRFGRYLWGTPRDGAALTGLHKIVTDFNNWAFLHHMMLIFVILTVFMLAVTKMRPLTKPVTLPQSSIDVTVHPQVYLMGSLIIAATTVLYIVFW